MTVPGTAITFGCEPRSRPCWRCRLRTRLGRRARHWNCCLPLPAPPLRMMP